MPTPSPSSELVVLLDERGRACGTAPKAGVHGADTPTHLAFSLYVFDAGSRLLVSRRALDKATFPGLVTNSVCGHPLPGERITAAACRRARDELGLILAPTDLRLVLPGFAYRAVMHGIVEDERCPVLLALLDTTPTLHPDPAEVADVTWMRWIDYRDQVRSGTLGVSPWSLEQVRQLADLAADPAAWPAADPAGLPPAATW